MFLSVSNFKMIGMLLCVMLDQVQTSEQKPIITKGFPTIPLYLTMTPRRKISASSSSLRSSLTLEYVLYSCTFSESSETSKEVASCWSCSWMPEAVVSTSSGKRWVGKTTFSAGVYVEEVSRPKTWLDLVYQVPRKFTLNISRKIS